jgi:hypothetical protein
MVERKGISSDGVVDRIGKSAWSVGENGVISVLFLIGTEVASRRTMGLVLARSTSGETTRSVLLGGLGTTSTSLLAAPRQVFLCFIPPTPLPATPFSPVVPASIPTTEDSPRASPPSRPSQLAQPSASALTSPPPHSLSELPRKLVFVLRGSSCCGHPSYELSGTGIICRF